MHKTEIKQTPGLFQVNSLFRITSTLQNIPGSQEKIKKKGQEKKVSYIAKYTGNAL